MNDTTIGRRRSVRRAAGATTAAAVLLTLAACSSGNGGTDDAPSEASPPTASEAGSPSPSEETSDAPTAEEASPPPAAGVDDGSAAAPVPREHRPGRLRAVGGRGPDRHRHPDRRHDGFDRVVYEMDGTGTPGWRVEYVEEAIDDGSGNVFDLDGDGVIQVMISGSGYPMDTGVAEYSGPNP
ncbi:hypothetical protein NKG05_02590 [Oerskovia sp. M15]